MKKLIGERFWKYVKKLGPKDCWVWTGGRFKSGYGQFRASVYGQPAYAHRQSYEMHVDDLMPGDVVRHKCDNRPCVNPLHLLVGTHLDNHLDAVERGRFKPLARREGAQVHNARLDDVKVRRIRELVVAGMSSRAIAAEIGVSKSAVKNVRCGATWSHVP